MNRCYASIILVSTCLSSQSAAPGQSADRERRRTPVVDVFEKCRDAVVNIATTRVIRMRSLVPGSPLDEIFEFGPLRAPDRRVESVGSGVLVHASGYIVTNAHVISQASDVQVTFADKQTLSAEVIAVDPEHDLAVLKVTAPQPLPFLKIGRSDDVMIGESVIAIGNPLGLQHTVTAGIVSALDRELNFRSDVTYRGLIQTDAPINPGNSGGPLLNVNGELIGINTAIRGDAQNIGFAIPSDRLWELLPVLLDVERRKRVSFGLGVSGTDARIASIRKGSPAAEADLAVGDRIVRFNGEPLQNGIDYYVHLLGQAPDTKVELQVERGQRVLKVTVPLVAIPLPDGAELARRLLGLELAEIPEELRRKYDLPPYARLLVEAVERGSPADRARIRARDLIIRLDRVPVRALTDVGLVLEKAQAGETIFVEGLRIDTDWPFLWSVMLEARRGGGPR